MQLPQKLGFTLIKDKKLMLLWVQTLIAFIKAEVQLL